MRKIVLLFSIILLASFQLAAQNQRVSGTVTGPDQQPLGGVTVVVAGTNTAALTEPNGRYEITAPTDGTLQFVFFGMAAQSLAIANRTVINVQMEPDALAIENVVITASGMTRSERSLGYAASTIRAEDIVAGKSADMMSGLIGKIAGVSISSAGATGTSQKVIVRGFSSITGSNQPLYVIDGMPLQNNFAGVSGLNDAMDFGTQGNDVNPSNIESMTVLKGASATALYGSRAANGVVMITTKSGRANQKVQVTYDLSVLGSNVLRVPQTQQTFGQGWQYDWFGFAGLFQLDLAGVSEQELGNASYLGTWVDVEQGSWGPKLDGRQYEWNYRPSIMYDPSDARYGEPRVGTFNYKKNSVRDFYETGLEVGNTISVSGGSPNSGFYASYGNFVSNGILPTKNDQYQRNTFTFNGNTNFLNNKAFLRYSINYSRKDTSGALAGQGFSIFQNILQNPTSLYLPDISDYTSKYDNEDNYYTPYSYNPYWVLAHNAATYQDDRVWGNVELSYEIVTGLKAIGRISGDFTSSTEKYKIDRYNRSVDAWTGSYGGSSELGWYNHRKIDREQLDAQAMLTADYEFGDFTLNGMAGWNLNQRGVTSAGGSFSGIEGDGWFNFMNYVYDTPAYESYQRRRLIGLLGQVDFGFKHWAYLSVSARNDWSSTLPAKGNSFFYWGANLSLIPTDMFPTIKSNVLNFLKIRAAYGQTGNDAPIYLTEPGYAPSRMGVSFADVYFPIAGNAGFNMSTRIPASELRPEITTDIEFGFDLRMFDNRLTLDFSYYDRVTKDQIVPLSVAPESGFASRTANLGKIGNKGIEIALGGVPVRTRNFTWDLTWTFTRNRNKVIELMPGIDEVSIYGLSGGISYIARVGEPIGTFTFDEFRKVPDGEHAGKYIVNNYGELQTDSNSKQILGSREQKFTMGLNNQFTYRNLSLGFTFDWRHGGLMYSNQKSVGYFVGTAPETAYNDRNPFILPNTVRQMVNPDTQELYYIENNIPISMGRTYNNYWYTSQNRSREPSNNLIDKSYIKLRELNLTYRMPSRWFEKTPISGLEVSLVGRNLFLWTPKDQVFIDPDTTNYGNDLLSEFGEYYAAPSTRVFGGSLRLVF
jgi:TonB-linked SusC/RagA family outer membrane protein